MRDTIEDTVFWAGSSYRTVLQTKDTGGAMAIVDSTTEPGMGPPLHIHAAEDEAFVVLSGEVEFFLAGQRFRRSAGGTAFIPRGVEHTFRITSDTPSRHLVILTPGVFEGFFFDMAKGQCRIPEDMPDVLESAARHNLTFTGPPLADL
jgi:quercetin dioxygenase-like cupin family protein